MEMYMGLVAIVAPRLLYVAVYVTGLVVALARANAHPTASRLAASGFIALILGSLIGIYGSYLTMQPNRPPISETRADTGGHRAAGRSARARGHGADRHSAVRGPEPHAATGAREPVTLKTPAIAPALSTASGAR